MSWYLKAIKNYCNFSGRASRTEFWMFTLVNLLIMGALLALDTIVFGMGVCILTGIYDLFILLPALAISIRRLHDIDKSGWWLLIALVPLVGAVWLFLYYIKDSTKQSLA